MMPCNTKLQHKIARSLPRQVSSPRMKEKTPSGEAFRKIVAVWIGARIQKPEVLRNLDRIVAQMHPPRGVEIVCKNSRGRKGVNVAAGREGEW